MPQTCRHIRANGVRCGANALSEKAFCFWHHRLHRQYIAPNAPQSYPRFYHPQNDIEYRKTHPMEDEYFSGSRANGPVGIELPPLEDAESIQFALSMLLAAIAEARIESKRAALMLYCLQIASNNVGRLQMSAPDAVQHVTVDEFGQDIASLDETDPQLEASVTSARAA